MPSLLNAHSAQIWIGADTRAGLGLVAGQDLQMAAGETITLAAGHNLETASGGALRIHTGQSIGVLAGAVKPGEEAAGKGITLIAGQGDISVQAQSDTLRVAAKQDVSIQSASAHVDLAAAKKITLATAGGARLTLEGGNIVVECPGKISVWAGKKSFTGPQQTQYPVDPFTKHDFCLQCFLRAAKSGAAVVPT